MKNLTEEQTNERDLLSMLKWLIAFHQPGDARVVVDAEPINQARRLVERIEQQHGLSRKFLK